MRVLIRSLVVLSLLAATPAAEASEGRPWTLGGRPCSLIPLAQRGAAEQPPEECPGVRPGAEVWSDAGGCTFNFLFTGYRQDAEGNWVEDARYIGTAGHCILESDGETSWAPGQGPEARDEDDNRIGEFAYAVLEDPKDFALIRIDPQVPASPEMCHWGGPTGINEDRGSQPTVLRHFGRGLVLGDVQPARTAVALGTPHPDHVYAQGAAIFGDSGSGIIGDDGRAVGVIVTIGLHFGGIGTNGVDAGFVGITRLAPQVARAEEVLGLDLRLETAPRSPAEVA